MSPTVRTKTVFVAVALFATVALAALPGPVGSTPPSADRAVEPAAFQQLTVPASLADPALEPGLPDPAARAAGYLDDDALFVEPGTPPAGPLSRPSVAQPTPRGGTAWKAPRYTLSGYASFYDNGTTAMRLPRGTIVRICGEGGCIQRVINDYGPSAAIRPVRIADLDRQDFFNICGCPWYSGTTWVTVSVY
jgi:hypothetical protein